MKLTLLVLAAGMGSRYGGLKQLDQLGPKGETIMDYSVDYAIKAGFTKVVFVIRRDMENDFKEHILSKYIHKIAVEYVFQELDILPAGFCPHPERVKPYGTAHAILVAQHAIKEPFAVINADDFYGKDAFAVMAQFLQNEEISNLPYFSMIGYKLANTLSENGSVSRGVCTANAQQELVSITEMTHIQRDNDCIINVNPDNTTTLLDENTPVSMNFWGFTPLLFDKLEELFIDFLKKNNDNPKSEFQIPTVINFFLMNQTVKIKILRSDAQWFGVTYQADKEYVIKKLANL